MKIEIEILAIDKLEDNRISIPMVISYPQELSLDLIKRVLHVAVQTLEGEIVSQ